MSAVTLPCGKVIKIKAVPHEPVNGCRGCLGEDDLTVCADLANECLGAFVHYEEDV